MEQTGVAGVACAGPIGVRRDASQRRVRDADAVTLHQRAPGERSEELTNDNDRYRATMPPALRWLIVMPLLLTPPYALSNRLEWLPAYEIPMTAVDHWWIAGPQWTWGYLLLFPLMWAAVACQRDAQRPRSVVLSFALAALIACTLFVLVPTTYPRPGWPAEGAYGAVIGLDTQRNACPSLHGAYSVLSAWWIARAGWSPWLGVAAWALAALVLCSTMAVRQHGVIDLGAGMLLGALIAWLWSRWSRSAAKRQSP